MYYAAFNNLKGCDLSVTNNFYGSASIKKAQKKVLSDIHFGSKFVGRQDKLQELDALLRGQDRIVTIHGFGGIGKTSLALQVAKGIDFDQVYALSLAGTPGSSQVIKKLARFL